VAEPLYRQIADDLHHRIDSGEFPPGSQLPTEQELQAHYGNTSRNTIRDAISRLSNRGLVVRRPGLGTFVLEKPKPFIVPWTRGGFGGESNQGFSQAVRDQGGEPELGELHVEVRSADGDLARELHLEEGAQVVVRRQHRLIDGQPSSLQTSFYPLEFVQQGAVDLLQARDITQGATGYLRDRLRFGEPSFRDRLTVRPPDESETAFFRPPDAATVLVVVIRRTAYIAGPKPIRLTVTVYPADRNLFVVDSGPDVPALGEIVPDS
jgi:GntR family transcriptional regulator